MKTRIRKAVLLFVMLVSVVAMANDNLVINEDATITINKDNLIAGTTVRVMDDEGHTLYKDAVKQNMTYTKRISLEIVPQGVYYVIIENDFIKEINAFKKSDKGITHLSNASEKVFKPVYKVENNIVKMAMPNPSKLKATINIYDFKGKIVGEIESTEAHVTNTLDFSEVPAGNYLVVVQNANHTFEKLVAIK